MASESKYQAKLFKQYKAEGWLVIRLRSAPTSIAATGTPDLLCIKSNGDGSSQVKFIEVKGEKGVVSPLQKFHLKKLEEMGFDCEVKYKE